MPRNRDRGESKRVGKRCLLDALVRRLEPDSYQRDPYSPDLLNQPDLLVVPELGRLVAVYVYKFRHKVSWRSSLAALEDLFEAKIHMGYETVIVGITLPRAEQPREEPDTIQLLRHTFDVFAVASATEQLPTEDMQRPSFLTQAEPKRDFFGLWDWEREYLHNALGRFDEDKYSPLVDISRTPRAGVGEIEKHVARRLDETLALPVISKPLVENVKGQLGRLGRRYKFEIDLGIAGHPNLGLDVLRSERYGSRQKIRYLMTKARLLRYEMDGVRLYPRREPFQPVLLVDGNIAGPDHDPYRYVRALVSVGWEILRTDQVGQQLPRLLDHADL